MLRGGRAIRGLEETETTASASLTRPMCASPLSLLRAGPPPPKVVLLSDALFFARAIPITPGATAAEAATQVELALEAVSPFPLAQLYYGWFWTPGSEHALAYAAYRRRFTADQIAEWGDAELVLPASAALFGAPMEPATTTVLTTPEGLTAVHWNAAPVPARIATRPLEPEADDEARARAREELLRQFGGSKTVIDLAAAPAPQPAHSDREIVFRTGELVSALPTPVAASLDVRDKDELAALRASRRRDVLLWRVALGCAAALLLLGLGELALLGGRAWQQVRLDQIAARKPTVDRIIAAQELANRINDLVNKRLLPLEMVTVLVGVDGKRKPDEIFFTRIETRPAAGLHTLFVQAQTTNSAQIPVYESQLKALPELQDVRVTILPGQGDRFELEVVFKPDQLKPAPSA